ncbi:MAG TPA: hypothetical protein VKP58_15205 [Candidatus Acidoferrum sp.]|nr:hypothetical protein [Candidatus Acidoferrum sp.]
MSQTKYVPWFEDDPKPNVFFFRSLFSSWKFLVNAALLLGVLVAGARFIWKYGRSVDPIGVLLISFILFQNVVSLYLWAMKRHAQVNELYLSGQITEQPAGSLLDQMLDIADNSMNDGLRSASIVSLVMIVTLMIVLGKFQHLK